MNINIKLKFAQKIFSQKPICVIILRSTIAIFPRLITVHDRGNVY